MLKDILNCIISYQDTISQIIVATSSTIAAAIAIHKWAEERRNPIPIITIDINHEPYQYINNLLSAKITICNQSKFKQNIISAIIKKPKGSSIAEICSYEKSIVFDRNTEYYDTNINITDINANLSPLGEVLYRRNSWVPPRKLDRFVRVLYIIPPQNWFGGRINIVFTTSRKRFIFFERRITIKTDVTLFNKKHNDTINTVLSCNNTISNTPNYDNDKHFM